MRSLISIGKELLKMLYFTTKAGTGACKMCNDEKDKAQNENRLKKVYEHPTKDANVLQRYKDYIRSPKRLTNLNRILIHSEYEDKIPSEKEITELLKIVMGEMLVATGCRPVAVLKLTVGAYADKLSRVEPLQNQQI